MLQEMCPERADADPRAGGQLEVLGEAAAIAETGLPVAGVHPIECIPGSQESLFIEDVRGEIVATPIAGVAVRL